MVIKHRILELYGKKIFELASVKPPFKNFNSLQNEACYLHIYEGSNRSYSEEMGVLVRENEGLLMKCGNYIYDLQPSEETGLSGLIAVHFHPDILQKIYEKETPDFLKPNNGVSTDRNTAWVPSDHLIQRFMQDMRYYFENTHLVDEDLLVVRLKEIILLLLKSSVANETKKIIFNLFSRREISFKEVVEAHVLSKISLSDLADLTNHSLASFKREFKKVYNDSPANYMRSQRLNKAASMLITTDNSISQIAIECRFNDVAHFSNTFKAKFEISPKEYRLSQTNN